MSSSINVSAQAVTQLITRDISTAKALMLLLTQEHLALQQRDSGKLHAIIAEKQIHMNKLEQSAKQRSVWVKFLVERTHKTTEQCWDRLLSELDEQKLPQLWKQFEAAVNDCQQHNEINGKMIARGQRTLKKLLNLLRGQTIETPKLYNAYGDTQSPNNSHTVIKA